MATIPSPRVAPQGGDLPLQQLQAPPAAFGATVAGQGLEEFAHAAGVTADQLADHANRMQGIINKTQADAQAVDTDTAIAETVDKFKENTHGLGVQAALPELHQQLQDIREKGAVGLSPDALHLYNDQSRRSIANAIVTTSSYASQEYKNAALKVANVKIASLQKNMVDLDPESPEYRSYALSLAAEVAHVASPQMLGLDNDVAKAQLEQALGQVTLVQIKTAVGTGDVPRANEIYAKYGKDMTLEQKSQVIGDLRVGNQAFDINSKAQAWAHGNVDALTGETTQPAGTPGSVATAQGVVNAAHNANASPKELSYLQTTADIESHNNPAAQNGKSTGVFQFHPDTFAKVGGTDITDTGQQTTAALNLARQNGAALQPILKHEPTSAELYIAHQQGLPAAKALFSAPGMNVVDVLTPVYKGDAAMAKRAVVGNGGRADMTAGQFTDMWKAQYAKHEATQTSPPLVPQGNAVPPGTFAIPRPQDYKDPDQFLLDSDKALDTYISAKYAGNVNQGQRVEAGIRTVINRGAAEIRQTQKLAYSNLLSATLSGNVENPAALMQAYPTATADYAALSPQNQKSLDVQMHVNANAWTPERQTNTARIEGLKQRALSGDPAPFLALDLQHENIPGSTQLAYMKDQADVQNKVKKGVAEDTAVMRVVKGPQGQAALGTLGIKQTDTGDHNPLYDQFIGSLQAQYEAFEGAHGKPPKPEEINQMVNAAITKVGAKPGGFLGFGKVDGTEAFKVPDDKAEKIIDWWRRTKGTEPTQVDIARKYWSATHAN